MGRKIKKKRDPWQRGREERGEIRQEKKMAFCSAPGRLFKIEHPVDQEMDQ